MRRGPRLKWHKLRRRRADPPFLRANLAAGLAGGAALEVDLVVTADGDFVCLHDLDLGHETTGAGPVAAASRAELMRLSMLGADGRPTGEPPLFLDEIVAAASRHQNVPAGSVQLDIKEPASRFETALIQRLIAILGSSAPAFIASSTDWRLVEHLRSAAPGLRRGFDPLDLYGERLPADAGDFVSLAETTLRLGPDVGIYYLEADLLLAGLEYGVNIAKIVSRDGAEVDAWTVDADRPELRELLRRLVEAGCRQITTNDPDALAPVLQEIL